MKTKVAMAISLAGVLAAGSAAALVNTKVLNGGSSNGDVAAESPNQQAGLDAAVSVPGTIAPSVSVPRQGASSPTQAVYAVGDSGTVTLETANDVLTIVAATPSPGWFVSDSENTDSRVEVKFQSGNTEVEFQANVLYGVVNTSVESHDLTNDPSVSGQDDHGADDGVQPGDQHGVEDDD